MNLELIDQVLNTDDIEVTYDTIGRIYHIHDQEYFSVTTALGACADNSFLESWKERTPDHERIVRQAGKLGTDYHSLGENFLLNKELPTVQWMAKHLFDKTVPILEKNITCVKAVELTLYSKYIRLAGRTDALVDWNGELAILDFKCIGSHDPAWVHHHWLQLCLYAHMVEVLYGLKATSLVLVCANKKNLTVKHFVAKTKDHVAETVESIKKFHSLIKNR